MKLSTTSQLDKAQGVLEHLGKGAFGFMGMSIKGNTRFSKAEIRRILGSLGDLPFLLLIADSLEAINRSNYLGEPFSLARKASRKIAENYLRGFQKIAVERPDFFVLLTSDIEGDRRLTVVREEVERHYAESTRFRGAIDEEVETVIANWHPNKRHGDAPLIQGYLLGEVAMSLFLHHLGLPQRSVQYSMHRQSILGELDQYSHLLRRLELRPIDVSYQYVGEDAEREWDVAA